MSGFDDLGFKPSGPKKSASFNDIGFVPHGSPKTELPEEEGILPTVVDKFAHGGALNFDDEIAGALEAAGTAAGVKGLGGKIKDIGLSDEGPTTDWDVLKHAYVNARDKTRGRLKQESEDHPVVSGAAEFAGSMVSPMNKVAGGISKALKGTTMGGAAAGAVLGGTYGLGNSDADNVADLAKDTAVGAGIGGIAGDLGENVLAPLAGKASNYLGRKLGSAAEGLAENATGATAKQSEKFAGDAGRQLLDRKLVRFGDSPANIADRVGGAMNDANSAIDTALTNLDAKGGHANAQNIVEDLEAKIAEMAKDPAQAGARRKLEILLQDIVATEEPAVSLKAGEVTKRGFRKAAGNWMDPEAGQAGKQAYLSYMNEVENAAKSVDPQVASLFEKGKETHGLLAPIQEATERRAAQLNQHPIGGFLDMATAAGGAAAGGPAGAVTSAVGRRLLAPRASSSLAVTADAISKKLLQNPEMLNLSKSNPAAFQELVNKLEERAGINQSIMPLPRAAEKQDGASIDKDSILKRAQGSKYGQVLQNAANKSDASFAAAHYVLAQRDPEFRKALEEGDEA